MSIRTAIRDHGNIIVGITGRRGSGKSTFAASIGGWRMGFADPIRAVTEAVFGSQYRTAEEKAATDAYWQERLGDDWSTGRKILQRTGTEVFRAGVHKDIWLYVMERRLLELCNRPPMLITIDDVRFDNEAEFLRDLGGTIVRVVNTNQPPNDDDHTSEAGISDDLVNAEFRCATKGECQSIAKAFLFLLEKAKPLPAATAP